MPLTDILLILCCGFILFLLLDLFMKGRISKAIDTGVEKYRREKYPQLFSYINFYNILTDSCNEVFNKEYLPKRREIDYFYDHVKYFSQTELKNRQLDLECQKQSMEKAQRDMEKIWGNAQEYYELIREYCKTRKILWADGYLRGFPPFDT